MNTAPHGVPESDAHGVIQVRGARENNLKNISVDVQKRRLTVFTGVSGSGKSSLVFGTIAAESQRLINDTYSAFVQSFMPNVARPDVDELNNLSPAIVVGQERMGANSRSTVGTATDANPMLRTLFSRAGQPYAGPASAFSFNGPEGACPTCEGIGRQSHLNLHGYLDFEKSISQGAIIVPQFQVDSWYWQAYNNCGLYPNDKPIKDFTEQEMHDLLHLPSQKIKMGKQTITYEGLAVKVQRMYLLKDYDSMNSSVQKFVDSAVTFGVCEDCGGSKLNQAARDCRIDGVNIAECCSMQVTDLAAFIGGLSIPEVEPLLAGLRQLLDSMEEVGLGYLSLDRESASLSGGEAQRVKLVRHLGSALTDITYVFDEPTVGLHPHDIARMNLLLRRLRDKGNTVLVVEHKPETILIADRVIDMGPRAGSNGGEICFEGTPAELRGADTTTGRHLDHRAQLKPAVRTATRFESITEASANNLKNVSVEVPLGVLTVITGVAGSGKSSLIHGHFPGREGVVVVDQSPIRGSIRSNPATYTGLLEPIRKAFAKANGVKPALFSANSEGACPKCKGIGQVFTDLPLVGQVASLCDLCEGQRFTEAVLSLRLDGLNISEVMQLDVAGAREHFAKVGIKAVSTILDRLNEVGLGYIRLGQPLNTLSGGERQRLKLAISMAQSGSTYVLDEPTTGLHLADVDQLLGLLDHLVDAGNSVIVIEHHQAVMAHADWIIDLGPEGGNNGGEIVFEGTPHDLVASADSLTAQHLCDYVKG
ncbi:excinuclease ABC subunit UvrA [Micrococcales bacterium 31B]|nr:excinuclease ABC subunit UvrA [Micrococcales bacterium 31B]